MRFILLALLIGALMTPTATASGTRASAPPPHLSAYGQLVSNFEGLLTRTLGSPNACQAVVHNFPSQNWTLSACRLAAANQLDWQAVFARHSMTAFATSAIRPPKYGTMSWPNVAPIRIAGLYVRCSSKMWLVENSVGSWLCITP